MEISYLSSEQNLRQTLIGRTQTKGTIMKIAVVAANGREGQLVVKEAVERGHDVTAVVRGDNKTVAKNVVVKDLFNLTAADLAGFDVVVDAFGAWTPRCFRSIPAVSSTCAIFCPASTPDSSWSVARAVCMSTRNTPRNSKICDVPG